MSCRGEDWCGAMPEGLFRRHAPRTPISALFCLFLRRTERTPLAMVSGAGDRGGRAGTAPRVRPGTRHSRAIDTSQSGPNQSQVLDRPPQRVMSTSAARRASAGGVTYRRSDAVPFFDPESPVTNIGPGLVFGGKVGFYDEETRFRPSRRGALAESSFSNSCAGTGLLNRYP